MYDDPKFRYPNTDAGKEKLIADLNEKVKAIRAKLPKYFDTLPKADLVIKRVPKYDRGRRAGRLLQQCLARRQAARHLLHQSARHRRGAELDVADADLPRRHPGPSSAALDPAEADIPLIRKLTFFSAYIEGWALYAEQLAVEMGMYDNDPMGHIGQLHDAMFRGVRLVVDTGMHAMKWSREKAIKYYVDTLGDPGSLGHHGSRALLRLAGAGLLLHAGQDHDVWSCARRPRPRSARASTSGNSTMPSCSHGAVPLDRAGNRGEQLYTGRQGLRLRPRRPGTHRCRGGRHAPLT